MALIRLFDPAGSEELGGYVDTYIADSTPSTMESIGEVIDKGGGIIAVFRNLSAVLTGSTGDVPAEENSAEDDNVPDENPGTASGSGTPYEEMSYSGMPVSGESISTDVIDGEPYTVIPVVYEGELVTGGGFGVDDTLPLPFGYEAPPNVDFSRHSFGFEHSPPLIGEITSGFGYRNHPVRNELLFHYGVDIAAAKNTDIGSFADGTVTNTGYSDTYGNYALIEHNEGVSSFYAHCSKILVKEGTKVKMGQSIALVGSTGVSTGPHLHFELRLEGKMLNPAFYTSQQLVW